MQIKHNLLQRGLLALLGCACIQALAHAPAAPGITDQTIRIGVSGAMSGAVAALGAVPLGMELKIKSVNAAGGVRMADGRTRRIELVIRDDALEPQRTMSNVRKLVEQDQVFALAGVAGTPTNQAIRAYVNQRQVPNLFAYSAVYEWGDEKANPWTIGLVPSFTTEAAVYAEYLKQARPQAKIGLLFLNTDMGTNFLAGLKASIAGSRLLLVGAQATTNTDPTVDTQLTSLRNAGADTLVVVTAPRQAAQAVKFAAESGWAPAMIVSYAASSPASLKPAGLANAKGVISGQFLKPVEAGLGGADAGVRQYLADHARFQPRFDQGDTLGQVGYLTGDALVRVLQMMKAPTRVAMMEAARNLKDVHLDLLLPGIGLNTAAGKDGFPIESMQIFEFDGTHYVQKGGVVGHEGKTPRL